MIEEGHHTIYRLQGGDRSVLYPEDRSRVSVHKGDYDE